MATRTATKSGFMSDTVVWGAAAPVAADSIVLAGFTIYADYSVALASVTATTGSVLIPVDGNIKLTITAMTLTNPIVIQGSPASIENTNGTPAGFVAHGVGGV